MARSLYDIINESGGFAELQNNYSTGSSMPQYDGNLQNFLQQYQQVQKANQMLNQGSAFARQVDGSTGSRRGFSLGGGTEGLYDSWQKASIPDQLAIAAEQGAEWWNNLPAQIAGAVGGDQAKQDWTFDASKFNLANGFDVEDLNQVKNFALSLPGMMVGGVLEGGGDLYEAATGRPINEYRVGEDGTWEMPNYQLDASQRAADLLDAAINLGGTFTGGAGRVVGGGAKAAAKAASGVSKAQAKTLNRMISGEITEAEGLNALSMGAEEMSKLKKKYDKAIQRQDLVSGMSKGIVTRATEGIAGKELGTAAGILSDMGDEAAEEFVQSYADDVRNKTLDEGSLDRALTGAAWGAAGGLLMGAGGRLVSSAANLSKPATPQASNGNVTPDYSSKEDWDALRDGYGASSYRWNSAAVEALDDANSNSRRATAAAIFTMTETDTSLGIGKSRLGTWNVKKIFEQGERDQEDLAEAFGVSVDQLREILYSSNDVAGDLTALAKSLPRGTMQVCVGRNPDTKNGGFYIDVSEFVDGEHLALHPLVAAVIGADWDGDTASVYFNPNKLRSDEENFGNVLTPIGYFSEMLAHPETHKSNIEWIWGGLTGDAVVDRRRLYSLLDEHLGNFGRVEVDNGNGEMEPLLEVTRKEIESALAFDDVKERDNHLSVAFGNIVTRVNEIDQSQGHLILERIINDFLMDDTTIVRRMIGRIVDGSLENIFGSAGIDVNSPQAKSHMESLKASIETEWARGSTTGGSRKTFQMSKSLGLLTYLANMGGKYNPIYRQYGGLKFHVNSVELVAEALVDEANATSVQSTLLNVVRSAFRLAQPGIDPTTAVESLCDKMAYTMLVKKMRLGSRKLVTKDDFAEFEREMVEVFSGYARIYDLSHEKVSSNGVDVARDAAYRTPIDGRKPDREHPDKDIFTPFEGKLDDEQRSMMWRQFHRVFDERPVSDIFDQETCDALGVYDGMTFGEFFEFVTTYSTGPTLSMFLESLDSYNPDLASWFTNAAKTFGTEADAVASAIESELSSSYYNFSGVRRRYVENGGHIDPRDLPMVLDYMNVLWQYIGNDALDLNLICSDEFFGSVLGQALFSDDASQRMNAIASLGIRAQFAAVTDAFFSDDQIARANAIEDLQALANISPLHRAIADDIMLHESTGMLEWASSLKLTLSEKETYYNDCVGLVFSKRSFLLNCLQDTGGKFAVSSVSAKNKSAMQARARMVKNSWDTSSEEVSGFFKMIDTYTSGSRDPNSLLENWFMDRGKNARIKLRADVLAMKVAASLTVDNGYIEKATIPELYSLLYSSAELANVGTLLGKMDQVLSTNSGHLNKSQFLGNRALFVACATDPEFRLWVYDEDLHENVLMTQKRLFDSVESIRDSGGFVGPKPIAAQIKALFSKYPHTASYFCEPSISIITQDSDMNTGVTRSSRLENDFIRWANPQTSSDLDQSEMSEQVSQQEIRNIEVAIENIKSLYYDDANAQTIITAMACANRPGLLEGDIDPREVVREIDRAANEFARFQFFRHYQLDSDVTSQARARTDIAITERRINELAKGVWNALASALEAKVLDTKEALTREQVDIIMNDFFTLAIVNELNEDGDFHFESSYGSMDTDRMMGDLTQTVNLGFQVIQWMVSQYGIVLDESISSNIAAFVNHESIISNIANTLRASAVREAIENERSLPEDQRRSDDDIRNDIASDQRYDEDARQMYLNAVDNLSFRDNSGNLMSLFDAPEGLLSRNDFSTRDDAVRSMRNLLISTGFYAPTITDGGIVDFPEINDMVECDASRIFDQDGGRDQAALDFAIDKYNKIWMRHILQDMSATAGGLGVNENMFQLADQLDQAICDSMSYLEARLEDGTLPDNTFGDDIAQAEKVFAKKGWIWGKVPEMDYSSQTLQSSISNQISANPAARNSLAVGVNGAQQKQGFAVGHLPAKIDELEYSYVIPVSKADIENNCPYYHDMFAVLPGQPDPVVIGSAEFSQYLEQASDDEIIQVFDPVANPHGLPTYNMRSNHRFSNPMKDYHRLSGILGLIADYSMEQMVMKAKKRMAVVNEISVMRGAIGNSQHRSLSISDTNAAFDVVNAAFFQFRNNFMINLWEEFRSDEMSDIGFGSEQALLLAQALTPGVLLEVEYASPDASGTPSGFIMVDASVFFDTTAGRDARTKFAELINGHEPPISMIKTAEVQILTLQELSSRIMDRISDNSGPVVQGQRQARLTVRQTEDIARDALADWSDYGSRYTGSVESLVYQLPPIGMETRTPIFATDNPVPPQILAGLTTDNVFGNSDTRFSDKSMPGSLVEGSPEYNAASSIGRSLGLVGGENAYVATGANQGLFAGTSTTSVQQLVPYKVTKVWASPNAPYLSVYDDAEIANAFQSAEKTARSAGFGEHEYYGSYGVCNDPNQVGSAIAWAKRTGSTLLITENCRPNIPDIRTPALYSSDPITTTLPSTNAEIKWIAYDGRAGRRLDSYRTARPSSGAKPKSRDSIWLTGVFDSERQMPAGLESLRAGDAVRWLFPRGQRYKLRDPNEFIEVDVRTVFPEKGTGPKRFLTVEEAQRFLREDAGLCHMVNGHHVANSDWSAFEDAGFRTSDYSTQQLDNPKGTEGYRQKVISYLEHAAQSGANGSETVHGVPRQNEIAQLVTDGYHIYPVFYPRSMPEDVLFCNVELGAHGMIAIDFGGESSAAGSKMSTMGAPSKGMVAAPNNVYTTPALVLDGWSIELHDAQMSESESSRFAGLDKKALIDVLSRVRALNMSNLFFKQDNNGTVSFSPAVSRWEPRYKAMLLSPSDRLDLWKAIEAGTVRLSDDGDTNDLMRKVFKALNSYGRIDPLTFFGDMYVTGSIDQNGNLVNPRVSYIDDGSGGIGWMEWDFYMVFQDFEYEDILKIYHTVDPVLCSDGYYDGRKREEYLIAADGSSRVVFPDGKEYKMYVRAGDSEVLKRPVSENTPSGQASVAPQHIGRRGGDIGYTDATLQKGIVDNYITARKYSDAKAEYDRKKARAYARERQYPKYSEPRHIALAGMFPSASRADLQESKAVSEVIEKTWGAGPRTITKNGGREEIKNLDGDIFGTSLQVQVSKFRNLMKPGRASRFNLRILDGLSKCNEGASWTEDMHAVLDDNGRWSQSEGELAVNLEMIVKNILAGRLPIIADPSGSADVNGRYSMALIPKNLARWLWNNIDDSAVARINGRGFQSIYHNDFNEFVEAMKHEQEKCDKNIRENISENVKGGASRKRALNRMSRALWVSYGDTSHNQPITGSYTLPQLTTDIRSMISAITHYEGWDDESAAAFEAMVTASDEQYKLMREHLAKLGYLQVNTMNNGEANVKGYNRIQEAKDLVNVLNNLAETSKVMAVLNPLLAGGNIADRMFHQGSARLWLWMGNSLRIGPYKSDRDHIVDSKIRKMSVESNAAIALYQSLREMEFTNEEFSLLEELISNKSETEILEFVENRKNEIRAKWPGRVRDWAYKFASGGSLGIKMQMETVVDRFVQFCEETPGQEFWFNLVPNRFNEDGSQMTVLEDMLDKPGGFANLMQFCLGPNSPSRMVFMEAMNSAKAGDIAQKNALWMFIQDVLRRVPFSNFIVTTSVARFPAYGLNVTGRILNYLLPISSMRRAFIEFASKTQWGKEIGIEQANIHTSMREAMVVDMCKMGVGGVAILLFGISGALQPPDDERKWGNIDEWLVFGQRAGETWWLEDLLGMALPLACFWKACEQGKPRFDIIMNGVMNACYANPMIRVADMAEWILNPAESLVSDYNDTLMQFSNAKGGPPSYAEYLQSNFFSIGMNWLSQFCTPSILKEWWRSSYSLEKSYKRDWERSASGQITEAGRNGQTEYVTYDEAMKRKLALRNPVLAYMFSLGDKSYMPKDMPDTIYYDEYQLDSSNELSIDGLDDDARDARVAYIIGVLGSYDDMQELADDGFHLDYQTLNAVASQVWDNYHAVDEWYNGLQADGLLDYYTLGNGSWSEGQRIAGELKKERDAAKQYWYDFYYDKLKNSPIAQSIITYNRYNTTYAQDVYGEVYATGQMRSPLNLLPWVGAPGNISNPEGTAGYSEDFNSISAATGLPLSQRALIPSESGRIELPDFKDLSATGDGGSYSSSYYDRTGTTPSSSKSSSNTGSNGTNGSGGSSGSGGSGRSGGGGGGGGRSSAPNTYGPSTSISKSNASRVMNTDRLIKPDEYYLRPDFETKGSREAYKRSDI